MGLFRDNETNNSYGTDHGYKSQLLDVESVGYFTSVAEDLNSGLPWTIQLVVRAGLELRASGLQVQRSNHSATLPPL